MQDPLNRQKFASAHLVTTLSGHIFATKACVDIRGKNLLNSNISSTCLHNMVNFGPLCGVEQKAPPIFGRAAITLGIGPHSS